MQSANKTIILAAPTNCGLCDLMAQNLSHHGFEVIKYERVDYKYKNIGEKVSNFFRKTILNDQEYKVRQQSIIAQQSIQRQLKGKAKIDFALIIRPDHYSDEFLEFVKNITQTMVGYQWDGLGRFVRVFDTIRFFDRFFVFDPNDLVQFSQYDLYLTTNFYFDHKRGSISLKNHEQATAYFVGTHIEQRTPILIKMLTDLQQSGIVPQFYIGGINHDAVKQRHYPPNSVNFLDHQITFDENLEKVANCDIVVDILNSVHGGLSFRIFEALYYEKKLITNNPDVRNYEFYNTNNILVWDQSTSTEHLRKFMAKPYEKISHDICHKYSFSNWINYMLGIEPYLSLENCGQPIKTNNK